MTTLSSAGWIVHDVGLATSIGGSLFGKVALEPALDDVSSPRERDQMSEDAWRRFSWINLAGHVAFAVPWLIGRRMLSGREVSARARTLTRAKDIFVGASLITGIASIVLGRVLGSKARRGAGPEEAKYGQGESESVALEKAVGTVGTVNLIATIGVIAVTSLLAMEAGKSGRFAVRSKFLP